MMMAKQIVKENVNRCLQCPKDGIYYEWYGRIDRKPKCCPRCKSYRWSEKKSTDTAEKSNMATNQ